MMPNSRAIAPGIGGGGRGQLLLGKRFLPCWASVGGSLGSWAGSLSVRVQQHECLCARIVFV